MGNAGLVTALGPALAASFAVQRLLEILDPVVNRLVGEENKRIVLGLVSLAVGLGLAYALDLQVLSNLGIMLTPRLVYLDYLVTGLIVSSGTEGFNSVLKFLNYKKEEKKAEAVTKHLEANKVVTRTGTTSLLGKNLTLPKDPTNVG